MKKYSESVVKNQAVQKTIFFALIAGLVVSFLSLMIFESVIGWFSILALVYLSLIFESTDFIGNVASRNGSRISIPENSLFFIDNTYFLIPTYNVYPMIYNEACFVFQIVAENIKKITRLSEPEREMVVDIVNSTKRNRILSFKQRNILLRNKEFIMTSHLRNNNYKEAVCLEFTKPLRFKKRFFLFPQEDFPDLEKIYVGVNDCSEFTKFLTNTERNN